MAPALQWIEVQGFRGFCEVQRLDFEGDLALIYGPNSQGKTSLTEAVEFLMTGSCIRRELLGGAKYEFDGALTNVHLPDGKEVFVRAKLRAADGTFRVVKRTLTKDYEGDQEIKSDLTIDEVAVEDLSSLGISLGDGAVPAPVLVQHSLRYALCAKPSDRAKYFSSLLDIEDLDEFRQLVEDLKKRCAPPDSPALALTEDCAEHEPFNTLPAQLRSRPPTLDGVEGTLGAFVDQGLTELGLLPPGTQDTREIDQKAEALTAALASRDEQVFSLAPLQSQARPTFTTVATGLDDEETEDTSVEALTAYNDQLVQVDADVARRLGIFRAVVENDHLAHIDHPVDCPVCTTVNALTPDRIETMRTQVAATHELATAQQAARRQLSELKRTTDLLASLDGVVPTAAHWTAETRVEQRNIVERLLGSDERLITLIDTMPALRDTGADVQEAAAAASVALQAADDAVLGREPVDVPGLTAALTALTTALDDLDGAHADYKEAHQDLAVPLRTATEARAGVTHLRNLIKLVEDRQALVTALREKRARARVERGIDAAVKHIETARGKVFDERLSRLRVDVKKWWDLLRPGDVFAFKDIQRMGTGRRFVTLESELQGTRGVVGSGVTRHALGIASTSQLNALGLAAFLSRAVSLGVPFVLLDDPVEAGDEGHLSAFVLAVIPELRALGIQVIVTTHDEDLNRGMSNRYERQGLEQFTLTIENPREGVIAVSSSDGAKALLDQAVPWLHHTDPAQRQSCSNKLRVAAERVVKEILVRKRREAGDAEANVSDYDGVMLKSLVNKVTPYLEDDDPDAVGKLNYARGELNPGSHEGPPPDAGTLVQISGDLRAVWKAQLMETE